MYNRLIEFINKHDIPYKYQFGFRGGMGTNTAMIILMGFSWTFPRHLMLLICGHRLQSVPTDSTLFPQIRICGHRLQSVSTDSNLFPQIRICGHRLQSVPTDSVPTDSNLWPQIAIRSHRFESVATDCNTFPQIQICSHRLEYVTTASKYFLFSDVPLKAPYL